MIKKLIFIIGCYLSIGELCAQSFKEFSGQEVFIIELQKELVEKSIGDSKKDHKDLLDKFEKMWGELNSFSPAQKDKIYATSNALLTNKLKVLPEVRDYISTVIDIVESGKPESEFHNWHRTVDKVIASRSSRRDFSSYMAFSSRLFKENILFATGSVEWVSDNAAYRFEMEDEVPRIVVPMFTLECRAKGSNAVIANTNGVLYPLEGKWIGKGGTVTWEKAGLDPNKVYAIVNNYEILMKTAGYEADSVTFYNTDYFDAPLVGKLEDKVQAVSSPDKSSFPQFSSYSKRFKIKNIDKNVDYEGGFSQTGARFIASGSEEDPALLTFYLEGKPFLQVSTITFSIKEDKITSTDAAVKFYLHEDSITHPSLDFKFFRAERLVNLYRANEGLQKTPYFDSYHQIDIYSELITWNIDEQRVTFKTIPNSSDTKAFFESDYYFRSNRFDQLLGLNMDHPLYLLKNCFISRGLEHIWDIDVAKCLKADKTSTQVMLLQYSTMGLVKYDIKTGKVSSTPRLYHYVAAKSELEDYDVLQISSDISTKENASLDLIDKVYTLTINGIENIILSDSHNVILYPRGGTVTMKKNRDFDFSGVVQAGRLEFFGSNYEFVYDKFIIEMPNVDSIRISVTTGEESQGGNPRLRKVKTVIETVKATLQIDQPDNKSGLKRKQQYPIVTSHENSFAYYERDLIQRRSYKRDNFYFELDPFVFDSLDKFENDRLRFEGTFYSADIFPVFREVLTLQEDYSLGFIHATGAAGFDLYRGKGKFIGDVKLSHEGLKGDGDVKYLTSTSTSKDFLFLPEQMQCIATNFVIDEQMGKVQYPPVTGTKVRQKWKPYNDVLQVSSIKEPIAMYDGSTLKGNLYLSPEELTGGGLFSFEKAELESKKFHFKFSDFNSDTADFRLKSDVSAFEGFQFKTNNMNAKIDFAKRKGDFISNDGTSMIEFPVNQYVAFMDRFTWLMDQDAIELSGGKAQSKGAGTMQFEGSRFISVHEKQDSLEFYSPAAKYDIRNSIIEAREVAYIPVADALIHPDNGLVTIEKKAKMKSLVNSKIVANAVTKYHTIDSATVDIFAKRDYIGTGTYTYKDVNGKKQQIRFSTIGVDTTTQTYAKGDIGEERNFTLSPYFDYKGKVLLHASVKDLTFDGYTRIYHQCEPTIPRTWFAFNAPINAEDLYIPITSTLTDQDANPLSVSLVLDPDTGSIYTAFLSARKQESDIELLPADGYLFYHPESSEYRVSNMNKLIQQSLPGQYLSIKANECQSYGEGKLGFGFKPGQVSLQTVGNMKHDLKTGKVDLDVMMLMDFFFADNLIDDMGKLFAENAVGDPSDYERETYQKGLRELIGATEADKLISAVTLTGQFRKFPDELEKRLFLTEVKMKWNPETKSYQSVGKIGIGNIGKRQVNVKVNGKVEVVVGTGAEINIYLEADKDTWYYFKYSKNVMQAFSSQEDFNNGITAIKADKRKIKVEKGESPYSYMLSSKRRKDDFIAKF